MNVKSAGVLVAGILLLGCGGEDRPGSESTQESNSRPPSESAVATPNLPGSKPINAKIERCTFTEEAQIYGRPAAQWRAEQAGANGNLNLTVWRMDADGAHQINMYVQQGDHTYRINTVEGSSKEGSGTVTVTPEGGGAKFEINGKDQSGNDLRATIFCGTLGEPVIEGG